jgi:hypothetical protein
MAAVDAYQGHLFVFVGKAKDSEPVTMLLRSGHMLNVGRDFDESTFARVVALLSVH